MVFWNVEFYNGTFLEYFEVLFYGYSKCSVLYIVKSLDVVDVSQQQRKPWFGDIMC